MSAILLTVLWLVSLAITGIVCVRSAFGIGEDQGLEEGETIGWENAHKRVAEAIGVSVSALNTSLLNLELHNDSDPETLIANIRRSHQLPEEISE